MGALSALASHCFCTAPPCGCSKALSLHFPLLAYPVMMAVSLLQPRAGGGHQPLPVPAAHPGVGLLPQDEYLQQASLHPQAACSVPARLQDKSTAAPALRRAVAQLMHPAGLAMQSVCQAVLCVQTLDALNPRPMQGHQAGEYPAGPRAAGQEPAHKDLRLRVLHRRPEQPAQDKSGHAGLHR